MLKWQNTPIAKALKEKNAAGKIVCPFSGCGKQYVGIPQFGKHMMKDHYKELSVRDQNKISQMTSTPLKKRSLYLHSHSHLLKYDFQSVKTDQRAQQKAHSHLIKYDLQQKGILMMLT